MTSLHIKTLAVSGFRGIRKGLDLQLGRRLTIIYGGNATGKSSLAQAIEFALSGQVVDHEDNPIAARYLSNTLDSKPGRVALCLSDGPTERMLIASTDETRGTIEERFREAGAVEWPDRQRIPVTVTHITSQGTLARVLAADSVTRSDLSGLCAGAYLRSLLTRATRLADHFRQASTGRNSQAEIKDARAAFEAARVLHESLSVSIGPPAQVTLDAGALLGQLADELGLPDVLDVSATINEIDRRLDAAEQKLASIQRLLVRMRDLGQYEAELQQLRSVVNESVEAETSLLEKRDLQNGLLSGFRDQESAAAATMAQASTTVAASERYQRSQSLIEYLESRRAQTLETLRLLRDQLASLDEALAGAVTAQRDNSQRLAQIRADHGAARNQHEAVLAGLSRLASVPESPTLAGQGHVRECERLLQDVQSRESVASRKLREAQDRAAVAEHEFRRVSEGDARFLAATSELESLITDDACTLCGHAHGTRQALEAAIQSVRERRASGLSSQREQFEQAAEDRREREAAHASLRDEVITCQARLAEARRDLERLLSERAAAIEIVRQSFTRHGVPLALSDESLSKLRDDLAARISVLEQDLGSAAQAAAESLQARTDLEREVSARGAEIEQLTRLARELQSQIEVARQELPELISPEAVGAARTAAANAELGLAELQQSIGKVVTDLAETERSLGDIRAQRAGAQRRLDVIEGQLASLDADLRDVGATRDVAGLLKLEGATRQLRDRAATQKARASQVREEIRQVERYRARIAADEQLQHARQRLEHLQIRQARLSKRAAQFAELQAELERVQSSTAEAVLRNVRAPVGIMFRAMTAGCQWDIEFGLGESGNVEARLLDGLGGVLPATAVLNSAYLNISAIALRIALASQQNWTRLRTVVLDDPILEMDSLTQSALIDGLEAILASRYTPWRDLQLVITTWSEDFAVLAAHKLAHLNAEDARDGEQFLIYRLGSQPDGKGSADRHAPRWRTQASAA